MTAAIAVGMAWRELFEDMELLVRHWNGTHPAILIIRETSRTAIVASFVVAFFSVVVSVVGVGVGFVDRYLELALPQTAVARKTGGGIYHVAMFV